MKFWRAGGREGAGEGLFHLGGRKVDCAAVLINATKSFHAFVHVSLKMET